jgi:hypothetical protein
VPNSKELVVGFIQVDWKKTAELRVEEIERLRDEVRQLQAERDRLFGALEAAQCQHRAALGEVQRLDRERARC